MPQVSVLMVVQDVGSERLAGYLHAAIRSIEFQTFDDWELVIVDDGSADRTPALLAELARVRPRLQLLRTPPGLPPGAALNLGLSRCAAPYVARMEPTDVSSAYRLERQVAHLDAHPEQALCGTGTFTLDARSQVLGQSHGPAAPEAIRETLERSGNCFVHGSVMFRAACVRAVGGYSESPDVGHAEDYDLWGRLAARHPLGNVPGDPLYFSRLLEDPAEHAARLADRLRTVAEIRRRLGARAGGGAREIEASLPTEV